MSFKYTIDGNGAVSHIAYAFSDVAAIYPIISRDEYLRMETENFLDHYHHKSVHSLIAALAGDRLSDQDLDELSDFVRKARERSEGK